jgi:hypothetical protein
MRDLLNITTQLFDDVTTLKRDVINQVKRTDDEELLDRIYTVLNKTNLHTRISSGLTKDTDTKGFVDQITQIIIDTKGTYAEKYAFINAFPHGYINLKLMLSGKRVTFEELLTTGVNKDVPLTFVRAVFEALKHSTFGTVKGPGEFALAALSPKIVITGKGDLHIDNKTIEVKASAGKEVSSGGGRLGTPGFLNHQDVAQIIVKNMPKGFNLAAALAPGKGNLGLDGLVKLTSVLTAQKRAKLGRELFGSIFGNKADISKLVSALSSGQSIIKPYIKTNYEAYQKDSNFDGVMLMNFALGELRYYLKSEELADDVYNPAVYIISKKEADAARQILSQVTLRPFTEPPVEIPTFTKASTTSKGQPTAKFQSDVVAFAGEIARRAGIRDHKTITAIAQFTIAQFSYGVPSNKIMARLKAKFPQLVKKKAPAQMESMEINPDRPTREMVSVLRKKR